MRAYPFVDISLLLLNRQVAFIDEGVDIGFRIAHLADSFLRAIRLGEVRQVLCASPDYLAEAGIPGHPQELAEHRIIAVTGGRPMPDRWRFLTAQGDRTVHVKPRLAVNTVQAALEAAARGGGIVRVLSYQLAPLESAGCYGACFPNTSPQLCLSILYIPPGGILPSRIRLFIDHTVAKLRGQFAERT